jgi:tetratricopeptide (TPR) repeat protein
MKKDLGKAISDFTNAIRLGDDYLYVDRADIYEMQGDFDKATADWTQAIRLRCCDPHSDPSSRYDAFFGRGRMYGKKGDLDKAIADYTEALRYQQWDVPVRCCRAETYAKKGKLERAISDYSEAAQLRSDNAYPFIGRACLYIKKGELDKAIADCTESIRLKPDFAAAFNYRAVVFLRKGNIDQAIVDATEAIRLDPTKAAFFETRSSAYAKKGGQRKANEDRSAALRLASKNKGNDSVDAPFQIVRIDEGPFKIFTFADRRCSKYVPSTGSFSEAQLKEMAKTSLDETLFVRYIEAKWPVSRLKNYCTKDNRWPSGDVTNDIPAPQNLVGKYRSDNLPVHKDTHAGFDNIYVYVCEDDGKDFCYVGSSMTDWRRWEYSLNIFRGKDHWAIIEDLPNDFMDHPEKYLPGRAARGK